MAIKTKKGGKEPPWEKKRYYQAGAGEAWEVLSYKLRVPPSLEVFMYAYENCPESECGSFEAHARHYEAH